MNIQSQITITLFGCANPTRQIEIRWFLLALSQPLINARGMVRGASQQRQLVIVNLHDYHRIWIWIRVLVDRHPTSLCRRDQLFSSNFQKASPYPGHSPICFLAPSTRIPRRGLVVVVHPIENLLAHLPCYHSWT